MLIYAPGNPSPSLIQIQVYVSANEGIKGVMGIQIDLSGDENENEEPMSVSQPMNLHPR